MSGENSELNRIADFEIENPEEWARESAGTPSYCPYCGYNVVEVVEDGRYYCPECGTDYELINHRWDSN